MNRHDHHRRDYSSRGRFRGGRGGGGGGRGRFRGRGGRFPPPREGTNYRGNRFQENSNIDPKLAVLRDLLQMVTKVGALTAPLAKEQQQQDDGTTTSADDANEKQQERAVVASQAKNIQLLAGVVCGSNSELFLQYDVTSKQAETHFGPMATGIVHCVSVFPLQTPVYAALTLAIDRQAAAKTTENEEKVQFAHRTVQYCTHMLARDLDLLLLDTQADRPRAVTRCRLLLRNLCLLSKIGIVTASKEALLAVSGSSGTEFSVPSLLESMVQAAVQAGNTNVAFTLAELVLSTIPYAALDADWVQSHLMDPLQDLLLSYQSDFAPGVGSKAILLKEEQLEDNVGDDDDNDEYEDDEEDDDDEEGASDQVCDSLQDLWRTVKHYLKEKQTSTDDYRFALFTDAPWKELKIQSSSSDQPQEGTIERVPMEYTGQVVGLKVFPTCKSLTMMLNGHQDTGTKLSKDDIVVFGRLPIFGQPPDLEEDDDDDDDTGNDDDDEMEEEAANSNERLQAYQKQFGLTDRYFISQTIRDLLLCHESSVSDTGVERGSPKVAAEQVWSICYMIEKKKNASEGDGEDPTEGIEYAIVETILSLIVQCEQPSAVFDLVYLSRVLLELTRLEPAKLSPAIALAVSNLFEIYMPALTPAARYNLSRWFAFHLINTDYQWPEGYWKHWEPFVLYGWRNSRGAFVKGALEILVENSSSPDLLVSECLPKASVLGDHLLESPAETSLNDTTAFDSLQVDIRKRIEANEDPGMILSYLVGDEVTESISSVLDTLDSDSMHCVWWRTGVVIRALLAPAAEDYNRLKGQIEKARAFAANDNENGMNDDNGGGNRTDVLSQIQDAFSQYKSVILGVLTKDSDADDDADPSSRGGVYLLEQLEAAVFFSRTLLSSCIQSFLLHKFVSVETVLKWLLDDGNNEIGEQRIILRWWELATLSIRQGLMDIVVSDKDTSNDEMAVDEGEEQQDSSSSPTLKKAKAILLFLDPLLSYTVRRVATLLSLISHEAKGNKLVPEQVALVEGFKSVACNLQAQYLSLSRKSSSGRELLDAWNESAVAGPKLASLLDVGASPAVDLLRYSLERM